jgi:hypothetical protein
MPKKKWRCFMDSTGDDLKKIQSDIKDNFDDIRRGEKDLLALVYDQQIWSRANAVFGYVLKRGRKMRRKIEDYLDEAEEKGEVSDPEHEQVLACDLLWGGDLKKSKQEFFVAVRVSWAPQESDLQEAAQAAHILRSIGLKALGVVAGVEWTDRLRRQALDLGVVIVNDLRLDKYSWQAALGLLRNEN